MLLKILSILLLAGCSTIEWDRDERGYEWFLVRDPVPELRWIERYPEDLPKACRNPKYLACTFVVIQTDTKEVWCIIYLPKNPPQWLIRHEERHCEGWDHELH